ncbi:MAG TPA: DUF411 domain-containing protein [Longimicrobiaceae bacterium]|nr:DUF411 domain-containing protein [Longimicrobiaceae bacterium]
MKKLKGMRRPQPAKRPGSRWWLRRKVLAGAAALGVLAIGTIWMVASPREAAGTPVTVYAARTCSCCASWVSHLQRSGFAVSFHATTELKRVKDEQGVPADLGSCHTAIVAGYTIEGHVPADLVRRLLRERPSVAGLAVPGMPAAAPGMDGTGSYEVLAFQPDGTTQVYARR